MHTFPNAPYFFTSRLFVTPSKVVMRAIYTSGGQASKSNLTVRYAQVCATPSNSDSFYKKNTQNRPKSTHVNSLISTYHIPIKLYSKFYMTFIKFCDSKQ